MANSSAESGAEITIPPVYLKIIFWSLGALTALKAMTPMATHLGDIVAKTASQLNPPQKWAKLYTQVINDAAKQTTTCSFQLVSYFITGDIIRAIVNKVYAHQPDTSQNLGKQQVLIQVIPTLVQTIATVMSRWMGASQLQKLFDVDPDGKYKIDPNAGRVQRTLSPHISQGIDRFLRDSSKDKLLRPGRTALLATGTMGVYFAALIGLLYGLSSGLEKMFPGTFKVKQKPLQMKNPFHHQSAQVMTPFNTMVPLPMNRAVRPVSNAYCKFSAKQPLASLGGF